MSEYEDLLHHERRARQARSGMTLGDTLRVLQPEEVVDKCSDCPCCYLSTETYGRVHTPSLRITTTKCSDNPELVIDNAAIRHPECDRVGKRTVWPEGTT